MRTMPGKQMVCFLMLMVLVPAVAPAQGADDDALELQISIIVSDSRETIDMAREALERGTSFADAARAYSRGPNAADGGYVGYMNPADMRPELRDAVYALEPGASGSVIEIDGFYYIVQRGYDSRPADSPDFVADTPDFVTDAPDFAANTTGNATSTQHSRTSAYDASGYDLKPFWYGAAIILVLGMGFGIYNHRDVQTSSIRWGDGSVTTVYGSVPPGGSLEEGHLPGARLVVFEYCVSVLVFTTKRPSGAYIVGNQESTLPKAIPYIAVSLLFGWWGIPFGPIYTVAAVYRNLRGGHQTTLARDASSSGDAQARKESRRGFT
jgi:hypothetical protein